MLWKTWLKKKLAIDGLAQEMDAPPYALKIDDEAMLIIALDKEGHKVGQVQFAGSSAGSGLVWDNQHKCDRSIHVQNLNAI